jgi:hypothetical protein
MRQPSPVDRKPLAEERIAAQQELWKLIPKEFRAQECNTVQAPGCVSVGLGGFTVNQLQTLVAILRRLQ